MKIPYQITLDQASGLLILEFADEHYELPAEYLRFYSPSAEVRGHYPSEGKLSGSKRTYASSNLNLSGIMRSKLFLTMATVRVSTVGIISIN